jgi:TPP-dependent pyruvate/acetoin dehydrogenase alpha subunit
MGSAWRCTSARSSAARQLDNPMEIQTGMVFALETYCPAADGYSAARIEEEVVVTDKGLRGHQPVPGRGTADRQPLLRQPGPCGRARWPRSKKKKTNTEDYLRMYRQMVRIRTFEDNANQLYLSAKMPGLTHMYSGQEAVAVGICEALDDTTSITSTHRGHGHCVAKGAEVQGDVLRTPRQGGRLLPRQGRVDAHRRPEPRQSRRQRHRRRLDGHRHRRGAYRKTAQGRTTSPSASSATARPHRALVRGHEHGGALELPVIYACENNGYSEYTKTEEIAAGSLTARAEAFGIEAHSVDGQDVLTVNELAQSWWSRCRKGEGPFFIELKTYRYHGHHVGDINREYYRSKDEEAEWKTDRDPITNFGKWLQGQKILSAEELVTINDGIKADAEAAVKYALDAKYPEPGEVDMHVFAGVDHALTYI